MKPVEPTTRSKKSRLLRLGGSVVLVGAAVLLVTAVLAALIPTELDYTIETAVSATSNTGLTTMTLPYDSTGLSDASDLFADIEDSGQGPTVTSISRYIKSADALVTYTGPPLGGVDFDLHGGEGYLVQTSGPNATYQYNLEGDHDTATEIYLYEQGDTVLWPVSEGTSAEGVTDYGPPYCGLSATASDLRDEINTAAGSSVVNSIKRFLKSNDTYEVYAGADPTNDFDILIGESYRVDVSNTISFVPDLVDLSAVADDIDSLLSVTAYPGVPGCESDNGRLVIENNSSRIHFRVDASAEYEVREGAGVMACSNCTAAVDGCGACGPCDWCRSVTGLPIAPLGDKLVAGFMPHCDPSCDNRFCQGGFANEFEYCRDDSECGGDCVAIPCPEGSSYQCNVVRDLCVGGADDGKRCNNQNGNANCEGVGVCKDAGSVSVTVTGFRCDGDLDWIEKICSGGTNEDAPCDDVSDCPGAGASCISIAIAWAGTVTVPATTFDEQLSCPL